MNKRDTLLTVIILVCSLTLKAQPVITSSVIGDVGDSFSFDMVEATGFNVGDAGAGVTWDFSGISLLGSSFEFDFVSVESTGYAAEFPEATLVSTDGAGGYIFFKVTDSECAVVGRLQAITEVVLYYDDNEKLLEFPATYNDEFTDDLHSEFVSGITFERSGSVTSTVDGYGTLILPEGTYTDVLRVKIEEDYHDEGIDLPASIDYDLTSYYWYREGTIGALFQYSHQVYTGDIEADYETAAINNNIGAVTVKNINHDAVMVYPNPASEYVVVKGLAGMEVSKVKVFDLSGKMVYENQLAVNEQSIIDIRNFSSGVYIIELQSEESTFSKTFVKN